jgi:hypothetical protein
MQIKKLQLRIICETEPTLGKLAMNYNTNNFEVSCEQFVIEFENK